MGAANCAAVLLSMPISHHFLRLYSATGRARRRKWRYIKYTPLPFLPFYVHKRPVRDSETDERWMTASSWRHATMTSTWLQQSARRRWVIVSSSLPTATDTCALQASRTVCQLTTSGELLSYSKYTVRRSTDVLSMFSQPSNAATDSTVYKYTWQNRFQMYSTFLSQDRQ